MFGKSFTLILVLLCSLNVFASEHHIFFVHGLAGTEDTFGQMPNRLVEHLDERNQNVKHSYYIFVYETESNYKDSYDFSLNLANFVRQKVGVVNPDDKISFVAHSQGGLVTSIMLFSSYADREGYLQEYTSNFDAFVTLGTPFWGSKLADVVTYPRNWIEAWLIKDNKQKFLPRAGDKQLEEMSLFSYTIKRFRKTIAEMNPQLVNDIFGKMRILNIGGVANLEKLSKKYDSSIASYGDLANLLPLVFGGTHEYEADVAVSIPSSRFDSIYVNDITKNYTPGRLTPLKKSVQTDMVKFIPVYGVHASPSPEEFMDIAYLPESECRRTNVCEHPTYEYVFRHFMGFDFDGMYEPPVNKKRLNGFVVSFNIEFPFDHRYIGDDIEVTLSQVNFMSEGLNKVEVAFNKFWEQRSHSKVVGDTSTGFHFTGAFHYPNEEAYMLNDYNRYLHEKIHEEGASLLFKIKAKGFKRRYVRALVKPMRSTFININIEPYAGQ